MSPQDSRQSRLHVVSFNGNIIELHLGSAHVLIPDAGTWIGGVLSPRKTVVSELVKLIYVEENVVEIAVNGVGSDISVVDRVLGGNERQSFTRRWDPALTVSSSLSGVCGWGTLRNVITAHRMSCPLPPCSASQFRSFFLREGIFHAENLAKNYRAGDRIILVGYSRGMSPTLPHLCLGSEPSSQALGRHGTWPSSSNSSAYRRTGETSGFPTTSTRRAETVLSSPPTRQHPRNY